jgi:hypothetical protein
MQRAVALSGVLVAAVLAGPKDAAAQAWLPARGEGSVSGAFQRVSADGHYLEDHSKLPGYRTRASNAVLFASYGLSDRLAIGLGVPYVSVKYLGPEEPFNLPDNVLDDGSYHGTLQDLRFEVRYNLLKQPFALTPAVAAVIPSHSYDTLGEAAPGRDFQEYHFGAYAGRFLDPVLPRAYLQAAYSYAYVRQDIDIPLNYSSFGLEAGYFLSDSVQVSFLWNKLKSHGGLTFSELFEAPPEVFVNLDRVVKASYDHVGASLSVRLGRSLSAYGNYLWFVDGEDAHYGSGFSLGLSWSFRTSRADDVPLFPPAEPSASAAYARPRRVLARR